MMNNIKLFFKQSYLSFQALYGWTDPKAFIFMSILNPIFQLCFFALVDSYVYKSSDMAGYILGNAIILCSTSCVFGIGTSMTQDRYFGTLKILVVSRADNMITFLERSVLHLGTALITVGVALGAGMLIFSTNFSDISFLEITIVLLLGILSATLFGTFIATIGLITDSLNTILNLFSLGFLIFTGANYPVDKLPAVFRIISYCLPMTRSIKLGNALLTGKLLSENIYLVVGELGIGVFWFVVGYLWLKAAEKMAIVMGNLDLY